MHQSFVPLREPDVWDVVADTVGAAAAFLAVDRWFARRNVAEAAGFAAGGDVHADIRLGLLDRGLAPVAADDVIGGLAGRREIQRNQRLLGGGAAGEEQHRIVVGNRHQRAQVGLGFGGDRDEFGAAVAVLDDRRARIPPFQHFRLRLTQHALGQGGGAGTEIEGARHRVVP